MKNNFYLIYTALVILSFTVLAEGQVAAWYKNGPKIIFTSETNPPGTKRKVIASIHTTAEKNLFSRVFVDTERNLYFGYDLVVEPIAETRQFKLTFKSLSVQPDKIMPSERANLQNTKLSALPLPKYPEPQFVQEGDTLAIDVLINQQTGVKIVDLIKVVSATSPLPQTFSANNSSRVSGNGNPRPAKDFTIDAVELKVGSTKLLVNGQPIIGEADNSRLSVTGALVWFYLPRHGRFVLSLTPREGYNFQKVGTVRGNEIRFSIGGNQYEWISSAPVLTSGDETWNLWVLHDIDYTPEIEPTKEFPYLFGAADQADFLIKKK